MTPENTTTPEYRLAGQRDLPAVFALRHAVFVVEQDVPTELERDAGDARADHGLALVDGEPLATGRLLAPEAEGQPATIGRMAVRADARGRGLGTGVLALLERTARDRGWAAVELHAQLHARGFYDRLGYVPYGEVYDEAGIEHLSMRKELA